MKPEPLHPARRARRSPSVCAAVVAGAIAAMVAGAPAPAAGDARGAALAWIARAAESARAAAADALARAEAAAAEAQREAAGVRLLADAPPGSRELVWLEPVPAPGDGAGAGAAVASAPPRLVLLVHGLDEPGDIWNDLAPALRDAGHDVARFDYANDQAIARSTDDFALALAELRRRGVRSIDLVCHSMGGLIARDALTRETMYAGRARDHDALPDVERLITIGTPHAGSPLARYRLVGEVREQIVRQADEGRRDARALFGFLLDGAGGAGDDLLPGSAFLTDLASRPAPEGAKATLIVGDLAAPDPEAIRELLSSPLARSVLSPDDADRLAEGVIELAALLGDGAVPSDSAALAGADDVVRLSGNHRSLLKLTPVEHVVREALGAPARQAPAIAVILDRLARPATAPEPAPE